MSVEFAHEVHMVFRDHTRRRRRLSSGSGARRPANGPALFLTTAQVIGWRERGFALVDGVFPRELLAQAREDALAVFPSAGSDAADAVNDFGSSGKMEFSTSSAAVNDLTLHPRLLRAVAQLLGLETTELRLTQSDLWPKYGRAWKSGGEGDHTDQRMHVDYPNHTLVHPPPWNRPEAVEILVYLSDRTACGGATALVARTGAGDPAYCWPMDRTPGVGTLEWRNDRAAAEAYLERQAPEVARWRAEHLYPREVMADYRMGTTLFYRHDTWHRGTPLEPGALRLTLNMTFRNAESEWISTLSRGWSWAMYRPSLVMERLIARASVEQRCVLGFPRPGHSYWTQATIAAVQARYGALGIDMTPYQHALTVRLADMARRPQSSAAQQKLPRNRERRTKPKRHG